MQRLLLGCILRLGLIDVIHFTGEGDRQLAENIYAGIQATLQRELSTEKARPARESPRSSVSR